MEEVMQVSRSGSRGGVDSPQPHEQRMGLEWLSEELWVPSPGRQRTYEGQDIS